MNDKKRRIYGAIALVALALSLLGGTALRGVSPATAYAQANQPVAAARTITVVGEGELEIEPDIARANIGVEVIDPSAQEASAENKVVLQEIVAALQEQGVAEEDIQTANFSIWAERINPDPSQASEVRYHVTNNVQVTIRNLDNVGETLDAAINAGANNIYDVQFALEDPSSLESDVRQAAIEDARAKAEDLAALSGVTLGEVVSVSEVVGSVAQPQWGLGGGGGVPISPGQLKLTMQLQVVYGIAE